MQEIWPSFFLVGAQKAGTSSLHAYMKQHPQIYLPTLKEPHFFSQIRPEPRYYPLFLKPVLSESDYLHLFHGAQGYQAVGEASVSYLWDCNAAYRIRERLGDVKILILLRDPVERAFSQYLMHVREGVETLPFYEALLADQEHVRTGWGVSPLYIDTGRYGEQVDRYLSVFGPDLVKVLMFEQLKRRPKALLDEVARFLQIDPAPMQAVSVETVHNPHLVHRGAVAATLMRNRRLRLLVRAAFPQDLRRWARFRFLLKDGPKPQIDPRAVELLRSVYDPDIHHLEHLLGTPLPDLCRMRV